jgi:hypothetical protein
VSRRYLPNSRTAAARRLAARLRDVIAAIDDGTLHVRGHDGDGGEWHANRLREHLRERIERLEGGRR